MFQNAQAFNQPLNTWNTSKLTELEHTFWGADHFNQPLDHWDVSNVTSFYGTFRFSRDVLRNVTTPLCAFGAYGSLLARLCDAYTARSANFGHFAYAPSAHTAHGRGYLLRRYAAPPSFPAQRNAP